MANTYESWIFQRAHDISADTTASDALSLLQKPDVDKIRSLDVSGSGVDASPAGAERPSRARRTRPAPSYSPTSLPASFSLCTIHEDNEKC